MDHGRGAINEVAGQGVRLVAADPRGFGALVVLAHVVVGVVVLATLVLRGFGYMLDLWSGDVAWTSQAASNAGAVGAGLLFALPLLGAACLAGLLWLGAFDRAAQGVAVLAVGLALVQGYRGEVPSVIAHSWGNPGKSLHLQRGCEADPASLWKGEGGLNMSTCQRYLGEARLDAACKPILSRAQVLPLSWSVCAVTARRLLGIENWGVRMPDEYAIIDYSKTLRGEATVEQMRAALKAKGWPPVAAR